MTLRTVILWLLALAIPGNVWAQSQCTYLTPAGSLRAAAPSDRALPFINQLQCVLDEVRDRIDQTVPSEVVCTTSTIPASTRSTLALTTAAPLTGSEAVMASVKDATSPAFAEPPTVVSATGTTVQLAVFNRDTNLAHSITACAHVLRP